MITERRITLLALFIMLAHIIDFMLVMPLTPYFVRDLHLRVSMVGAVAGVYTLCAAVSSLIFARFIDKIKRKKAILISLIGLVIATALTASAWNSWSLLSFRFIAGIFGGPASALATTIITDYVPAARRGKAMGILMSSFAVSAAVAIPLGIVIATNLNWRLAFICVSALILILFLYIAFKVPALKQFVAKDEGENLKALIKNKMVWFALGTMGISMGTLFMLIPNFANFFTMNRHLALQDLSIMYLCGGVASILGGILGGRWTDKIGPIAVCSLGTAFMIFALVGAIYFAWLPIVLFFICVMAGVSMRMASVMTQMSEIPEPTQRGAFMSIQNSTRNFMTAIGSAVSGLFLSRAASGELLGMQTVALIAVVGCLLIPFMMVWIARYIKQRGVAY